MYGRSFPLLVRVSSCRSVFPGSTTDFCPLGADDGGSGTVAILEAYRALLESDFEPNRTVEFHWYSAGVRPPSSSLPRAELINIFRRLVS